MKCRYGGRRKRKRTEHLEKAILDKVEKVKEGKSFFASDKDKTGYSVGPDGSDQGGLILYDPTNGVLSPGDIPLKSGTGAFVPKS
jgi:hypothetical protein